MQQQVITSEQLISNFFGMFYNMINLELFVRLIPENEAEELLNKVYEQVSKGFAPIFEDMSKDLEFYLAFKQDIAMFFDRTKQTFLSYYKEEKIEEKTKIILDK